MEGGGGGGYLPSHFSRREKGAEPLPRLYKVNDVTSIIYTVYVNNHRYGPPYPVLISTSGGLLGTPLPAIEDRCTLVCHSDREVID